MLRTILLAAVALSGAVTTQGAPRPCGYTDLMPAYRKFAIRTANFSPEDRAVAFREEMVARYPDYYAPEMYGNEAKLDAQQVLWFPRDMVARMKTETPRAAELLLRDIDKVGAPGDRWFLGNTQVESLPERAGYYLGYLFAQSVGEHVELPALARLPLEQVRQKELAFLTDLARH
jgi:hypothetical protein